MQQYEYRAVPAPARSAKVKGIKDPAERYAHALSALMNDMAREGWEYWRAEVLPCTERKGLTGSVTVYHNLLVFRRLTADALAARMAQGSAAGSAPPGTTPSPTVARSAMTPKLESPRPPALSQKPVQAAQSPQDPAPDPAPEPMPAEVPSEPRAESPARPLLSRIPEGPAPPLVLRRDADRPVGAHPAQDGTDQSGDASDQATGTDRSATPHRPGWPFTH